MSARIQTLDWLNGEIDRLQASVQRLAASESAAISREICASSDAQAFEQQLIDCDATIAHLNARVEELEQQISMLMGDQTSVHLGALAAMSAIQQMEGLKKRAVAAEYALRKAREALGHYATFEPDYWGKLTPEIARAALSPTPAPQPDYCETDDVAKRLRAEDAQPVEEGLVCSICLDPATYHPDEGVWRHRNMGSQGGQFLCERYGYPIQVTVEEGGEGR